jgi:ATP-dependent RNA helicase DDX35
MVSLRAPSSFGFRIILIAAAYNAFIRFGQNDKSWCGNHRINHKALSRAVSIRKQLKKYLDRFGIPVVSCEGDAVRLRKCLVSGYFKVSRGRRSAKTLRGTIIRRLDCVSKTLTMWQNAARMMPDGTYRSAREGAVSCIAN